MLVRKFLYLDEEIIDSAYASIVGYNCYEKDVESSENIGLSGGVNLINKGLTSNLTKEEASKSSFKATIPFEAKLERIIEEVKKEEDGQLPFFRSFESSWNKYYEDYIFEGRFILSFSEIDNILMLVNSLKEAPINVEKDPLFERHLELINYHQKMDNKNGKLCFLKFVDDDRISCFAYLDEVYIRKNFDMQNDIKMICKVSRFVPENSSVSFSKVSEFAEIIFPGVIKELKEEEKETGKSFFMDVNVDEIKGPAFELVPIAIYK